MTVIDQLAPPADRSDAELISGVRAGDVSAYGELFARHRDAAARLARQLVRGPDADDLVSEAFAKVLNVLLAGGGPDIAFRAYLLTSVRRLHVDRVRSTARTTPTGDIAELDVSEPFTDSVISGFEGSAAARAYASLPERWQLVLWHLEVEGQKPAEIAALLGMTPNAVSALAYRAREGLRQAYLQMHTSDVADDHCRWTHDKLGAYVRNGLARRDAGRVEEHLEGCRSCTALYLELSDVNSSLAAVIGPLVLGTAAAGYLAAGGTGLVGLGGLLVLLDRIKDFFVANLQVVGAVGTAAGVAGAATVTVMVVNNQPSPPPTVNPRPSLTAPVSPSATPAGPTRTPSKSPTKSPTKKARPKQSTSPSATPPGRTVAQNVALTRGRDGERGRPSDLPTPASAHKPTSRPSPHQPRPTQAPPAPIRADLSVQLTFQLGLGLLSPDRGTLGNLTVIPGGVPAGKTATVRLVVGGGTLEPLGTVPCQVSGNTAVCSVTADTAPMSFKVMGLPATANATISAGGDVIDTDRGNNHASRLLGIL